VKARVFGLVHHTHPAAELLNNAVEPYSFA